MTRDNQRKSQIGKPTRRSRSRMRNGAEYVLARTVIECLGHMPRELLGPLSAGLGRILCAVIRSRRRAVIQNVAIAFGEGQGPDPIALCRGSLANLCRGFLEMALLPKRADDLQRMLGNEAASARLEALRADGGVICFGAHLGAYEVGGASIGLLGLPVTTVSRPLDNPLLESWLMEIRKRFGQSMVSNRGGLFELVRHLRQGRSVVVMGDINHRPANRIFVDFFGKAAATAPTLGVLARRTGRPLIGIYLWRGPAPMHFEWEIGEAIWPDPSLSREEDVPRLLSRMTQQIEQKVRERPEQWLWTHRRWKTRPEKECA